ncbi:unnamed protein product [Hydatigera taeniaeformis]|uniref:SET domain-containing protein n=1 Tax=Hydatigena taeniaeformis TaxID=6205 RepID=A0A0R3WP98_HYDTA|nr:unnamed protein product [Hydatigera taeniaeformis]
MVVEDGPLFSSFLVELFTSLLIHGVSASLVPIRPIIQRYGMGEVSIKIRPASHRSEASRRSTGDFILEGDRIKGAKAALDEDARVCTNYSANYVEKTFNAFRHFNQGTAIFTLPHTPIKCAGAPQKVMYLFEDYLAEVCSCNTFFFFICGLKISNSFRRPSFMQWSEIHIDSPSSSLNIHCNEHRMHRGWLNR